MRQWDDTQDCSTPEGVIVSITRAARKSSPRVGLLNARRRHRLDHEGGFGGGVLLLVCSTPEGVIVSITWSLGGRGFGGIICSTPEGVIVSITPWLSRSKFGLPSCSTPEGVIVSITPVRGQGAPQPALLNARRRHRLDHIDARLIGRSVATCSTPEGVIVSITSRLATASVARAPAQRPKASSSRSPRVVRHL